MEGIHTLRDLLRPGDWLGKIDLKDAYLVIPIHQTHRDYLRFQFLGKTYHFTCLPFGLSSAPWVFTKTLKSALALLRAKGVRLIAYIDDILVLAESKELLLDHLEGICYLLECLGFIINTEKSVMIPDHVIVFLGLTVNSTSMELSLPPVKIKQIRAEARKLMREKTISARNLAQLLGKMNATVCVIPPAPLFYRHLQMALSNTLERNNQNYEADNLTNRMPQQTGLVEHPHVEMEWQVPPEEGDRPNRFRCIPDRMGSPLFSPINRRSMVKSRSNNAHQLSGTTGSYLGSQVICQAQVQDVNLAENRQYHSSGIHKQSGRHSLQRPCLLDEESMDVVPGEKHPHNSTVSSRIPEYSSQCGVSSGDQQDGLEAESSYICKNKPTVWPTGSGPICNPSFNSMPTLLQLAARSLCRSHRRLPSELDTPEGLRQSSMEFDRQNNISGSISTGQDCPASPSLENTAVVSDSPVHIDRLPQNHHCSSGNNDQSASSSNVTTASRMAYLRKRYRDQQLSEEATDLMLNSWRSKTNKSYDSLFSKWSSWCATRCSDPISGPINEVLNFLANLYKDGYHVQLHKLLPFCNLIGA